MRLVIVESPYAGDVYRNVRYARAALADCLARGESPIASHLLLTQPGVLDDGDPAQRAIGVAAGHAWYAGADTCVVYDDLGISVGMAAGIAAAQRANVSVEYRTLGCSWAHTPEAEAVWPIGCIKRSACARHKACVYGNFGSCTHATRSIAEDVKKASEAGR